MLSESSPGDHCSDGLAAPVVSDGGTNANDLSGGNTKGQSQHSTKDGRRAPPIFGALCGVFCNVRNRILSGLGLKLYSAWAIRKSGAVHTRKPTVMFPPGLQTLRGASIGEILRLV